MQTIYTGFIIPDEWMVNAHVYLRLRIKGIPPNRQSIFTIVGKLLDE
ncbi:hypothetical protein [Nonlabens xiamenensis]|nr:hypothetical protein [Nonlabens xiamenensis]